MDWVSNKCFIVNYKVELDRIRDILRGIANYPTRI